MLHKQVAATVTETDQGEFTAIVSGWDADREKDTIVPTAFDRTIEAWQRSGKRLPLLFEHSTRVVGHVDPASMRASDEGLIVAGEVDRATEEGQQVWRAIKANTIGFSIGYVAESRPRARGGREIYEIDLLEISATSTPMHPATRALSWKSAQRFDFMPTNAEIRERAAQLEAARKAAELEQKASRPIQIARFEC